MTKTTFRGKILLLQRLHKLMMKVSRTSFQVSNLFFPSVSQCGIGFNSIFDVLFLYFLLLGYYSKSVPQPIPLVPNQVLSIGE